MGGMDKAMLDEAVSWDTDAQATQSLAGAGAANSGLAALLDRPAAAPAASACPSVVLGELIALADGGLAALVVRPGNAGAAALRARSTVDLHAAHIGRSVTLVFEDGDPARPIVTGVLRSNGPSSPDAPGQVQVDADGERLVVTASEQLVLRCGKASITLTRAGKVIIDGSYVSSRSSGVNRIKGGSVQLN